MQGLFQYCPSSLVKMYINSSTFPLDIKFWYNSSIFKFSSIDGHHEFSFMRMSWQFVSVGIAFNVRAMSFKSATSAAFMA